MDVITSPLDQLAWRDLGLSAFRVALSLCVFWIIMFLAKLALQRLEKVLIQRKRVEGEPPSETSKRIETLVYLLRQGVIVLIWAMGILVVLGQIGVNIGPILASAGIVGLAVGFGAQNLVRDVISGFFVILENQVGVGDVAIVNGTGGLVEQVNFRTIVLRDLSGVVHVFPNGSVTTLSNLTREWSGYVFKIGVAYKEDIEHVIEVMKEVGAELRADKKFGPLIVADIEIFGLDDFADSAVIIKGRIKTKPIQQWSVGRQYLLMLKKRFDLDGIELPFPHRSLYFGEASKPIVTELINRHEDDQPFSKVDFRKKLARHTDETTG